MKIAVGHISTLGRLRKADHRQVAALADSIKEVGLLNPITVTPAQVYFNGQQIDGFQLVAGLHRLEACKSLGWADVPATILDLDEQRRIIAECDENLCGSVLTPADLSMFTARRKEAYLTLYPETGHGKSSPTKEDNLSSFDRDQAQKTGVDARTVRRAAERGEKVCDEALEIIRGTKADTGVVLDRLKDLTQAQQIIAAQDEVNRRADRPKGEPRAPKVADAPESDEAALERQVAALMSAWNKAAPDARREFLSRIDSTVMDQGGWR